VKNENPIKLHKSTNSLFCRKKRQEKKDNQTSLSPIAVALSPALATTNQTISPYPIPELEFLMDTTNLSFCHKRLKPEQEELINRLVRITI